MEQLWGLLATGAATYFFLKNDNERNYSYKLDEVAGTGGFMNDKQKKDYLDKFEKDSADSAPTICKYDFRANGQKTEQFQKSNRK